MISLKFINTFIGAIYRKVLIVALLAILFLIIYVLVILPIQYQRELLIKALPMFGINFNSVSKHMDTKIANDLYSKERIMCAILIRADTFDLYHLQKTWVKHCNRICYLSGNLVGDWDVVRLQMINFFDGSVRPAIDYLVDEYHLGNIDWILITESDTYAVIENLRHNLSKYNKNDDLGLLYYADQEKKNNSEVTALVLSKSATEKIAEKLTVPDEFCNPGALRLTIDSLRACLESKNINKVEPHNTVNYLDLLPKSLQFDSIYAEKKLENVKDLEEINIFKFPIFFRRVDEAAMMVIEFSLYHLHPYGIGEEL